MLLARVTASSSVSNLCQEQLTGGRQPHHERPEGELFGEGLPYPYLNMGRMGPGDSALALEALSLPEYGEEGPKGLLCEALHPRGGLSKHGGLEIGTPLQGGA